MQPLNLKDPGRMAGSTRAEAKAEASGPTFPLIENLAGCVEDGRWFIECASIARALDLTTSKRYLARQWKRHATSLGLERRSADQEWSKQEGWGSAVTVVPDSFCVPVDRLEQFVRWSLRRRRISATEKQVLGRRFNLAMQLDDIKEPVEIRLLATLDQCCPWQMLRQYKVGPYRLDAFFPRINLGIEIDEQGHACYDGEEEKKRDQCLRDKNINVIRFNPDAKYEGAPDLELVKRVWTYTESPAYRAFRHMFKF